MTRSTKVAEMVKRLTDDIVRGRRAPGSALDEVTLAQAHAVSRTPVREALRQLEMSGLVEARPHRGAVVCDVSSAKLDDMFAVMAELEALCTRWAARAMTAVERQALSATHDGSARLVTADERDAYAVVNDAFHDALYDGSHNSFLAATTRQTRLRLAPFRRAQFEEAGRLRSSHAEHGRIVDCIAAADESGAEQAMRDHMRVVRQAVDGMARTVGAPDHPVLAEASARL